MISGDSSTPVCGSLRSAKAPYLERFSGNVTRPERQAFCLVVAELRRRSVADDSLFAFARGEQRSVLRAVARFCALRRVCAGDCLLAVLVVGAGWRLFEVDCSFSKRDSVACGMIIEEYYLRVEFDGSVGIVIQIQVGEENW